MSQYDENERNGVSRDAKTLMAFESAKKSTGVAYLLWFFLGMLGIHRFYAGRTGSGIAMLIIWIVSLILSLVYIGLVGFVVLAIWWFVDAFLLAGIISRHNAVLAESLSR